MMKQYDSYKDSGVEWIGKIPSHWEVVPLLYMLRQKICDGPHETPKLVDDGIPFISIDSLNDSEKINFDIVKKFISEEDYQRYLLKANLEKGDVLFSKAATIGKTAIVGDEKFMVWSPLAILKPNDKNVLSKYLYYVVNCKMAIEEAILLGNFNTQVNVGMRDLEKIRITCPLLSEQESIVSYLDEKCGKIDKAIATQEKRVELLKELRQNIITQAVTRGINPNAPLKHSGVEWIGEVPDYWDVIMLKRCAIIKTGSTPPTKEEKYYDSEDINWFTPGDIGNDSIIEAEKKISELARKDGMCRIFPAKSVYFVGIGATIGKVSYCDCEASANQQINAIIPNCRAHYKYITYCLKSQKEEIYLTANTVTLPIINQERTGSLRIPVPPLSEQQEIVSYIESQTARLDASIEKAEHQIELLQELKQSIITEVVTGKRKVV